MNTQIDDALGRLSSIAAHPGLDGLEDRVLGVIGREPVRAIGVGATISASDFALFVGALSNIVPATDAKAVPMFSPFGASSPLAPSTLLTGP